MFSFHKPRVYRSVEGCCICRAKSSSSRFTDSRRYENDSMKCFDLKHPRQGEICNACVLLVKRYKRLPSGSNRHWGHVVDARAGPGTKAMSRYKKHREHWEDGKSSATTALATVSSITTSPSSGSNATTANGTKASRARNKNVIVEKFSKIFKKNKKTTKSPNAQKSNGQQNGERGSAAVASPGSTNKRRVAPMPSSWCDARVVGSLPSTPDSLDSDYEETHCDDVVSDRRPRQGDGRCLGGATGADVGVVQFQTQTRAAAYRTRHSVASGAGVAGVKRKVSSLRKVGSKRRKLSTPRRHRRLHYGEDVQFFDESEWQERKTCCGMAYECIEAPGTLLFDLGHYEPCAEHRPPQQQPQPQQQQQPEAVVKAEPITIVEEQLPVMLPVPIAVNTNVVATPVVQTLPTPALKKHHLFFKRQSESFPRGDVVISSYNSTPSSSVVVATSAAAAAIPSAATHAAIKPIASLVHATSTATLTTTTTSAAAAATTTFVPRHSTAKVATISTATTLAAATGMTAGGGGGKTHSFLHKLKTTDSGNKLGKHAMATAASLTATRRPTVDVGDIKQFVKTVDKPFILATAVKPPTLAAISVPTQLQQQQQQQQQQHAQSVYHTQIHLQHQQPQPPYVATVNGGAGGGGVILTTAMASPSPTLSSSSSSSTSLSTKFSDNSSDSGFDENLQDRKSASPLQEDTERKLLARSGGVQTMFLASGVQIQGQQQNLMLTGNEMAAKLLQNRKQNMHGGSGQHQYATTTKPPTAAGSNSSRLSHVGPSTGTVKIAQIIGAPPPPPSSSAHVKMRTLYNNNTIQHENGITTIVPASSLAACSQTAAMHSAVGPSTVTITPAPHSMKISGNTVGGGVGSNVAHLNMINMGNGQQQHPSSHQPHQHHLQPLLSHTLHQQMILNSSNHGNSCSGAGGGNAIGSITNLNQKFILVKTATKYSNTPSGGTGAHTATAATTATAPSSTAATTIKTLNN